jgi:hypothetical protein
MNICPAGARAGWFNRLALAMVLLSTGSVFQAATVSIDPNEVVAASSLRLGVTHTGTSWEKGDAAAVARATSLLKSVAGLQNQSIMGWGAGRVLQPAAGAGLDFSGLDSRVGLMRSLGGEMALTLCTAPGWMKTSGRDWNMEDRVADEHVADFAHLCRAIAQRYTDIHDFVIWNEMKGYWNNSMVNSDGSSGLNST